MLWEREFLSADVGVKLLVVLTPKWELAAKKSIQENTKCPDICRWT